MLERFKCPVAFHAVRTRLLGNIASPAPDASPIDAVKELWGGELPEFETADAVELLVSTLLMGLWNRLARHQDRNEPFRLVRIPVAATREGLASIARVRYEEIDGFIEGLFGTEKSLDLPERAHWAVKNLFEIKSLTKGTHDLAADPTRPAPAADIAATIRRIREVTSIAEHEMHETVLACRRARVQMLAALRMAKPVVH